MAGVIGSTAGIVQLVVAGGAGRPTGAAARRRLRRRRWRCACAAWRYSSYAPVVAVALLALGVAGVGQALFGSTQATLPVAAVAPHERTAALGLLTTTIGLALPTGMVILGVMSSLLGAQLAMLVSALVGLVALAATLFGNGQRMRAPHTVATSGGAIRVGREGDPVAAQPELGLAPTAARSRPR